MADSKEIRAKTTHSEISIDQLGEMQPGLARLMAEVSDRYWIMYYAADAGNWKMAKLQSSEIKKAFKIATITRPKYAHHLQAFVIGPMAKIDQAIKEQEWENFLAAYESGVKSANGYHVSWDHEEIIWQLPDESPKHLKLDLKD